jgi:hypothetical protein
MASAITHPMNVHPKNRLIMKTVSAWLFFRATEMMVGKK